MTKPQWSAERHAWAKRDAVERRNLRFPQYLEWAVCDPDFWNGTQEGWEYRIKPEADQVVEAKIYSSRGFLEMRVSPDDGNIWIIVDAKNMLKSVRMIGKPDPTRMEAVLRQYAKYWEHSIAAKEILDALRTD